MLSKNREDLDKAIKEFYEATPIDKYLPHTHKETGFTLSGYKVICSKCNVYTNSRNTRVHLREHALCTDIKAFGVCWECKVIISSRTRIYKDYMLKWCDEGIVRKEFSIPKKSKIKRYAKNILSFFIHDRN